jgi:hypothetical protein
MPSLCGSAEATREWFRAFTAHSFLACRPLRPREFDRNLGAPKRFGERQYRAILDPKVFVALAGTTAMLDRISPDAPLIELRSSRRANHELIDDV